MKAAAKFAILALLVGLSYLPSLRGGYLWDDDSYLTANPTLVRPDGLRRIWTDPEATPQYYPVVFSSFWIEHRLWKFDPLGYRLVNVALHLLNALLLWLLLARIGFPLPWSAAAVFALHPLQVESVAWIAERKNVLSGCFYLLAAIAYLPVLGIAPPRDAADHNRRNAVAPAWVTAFLLFLLALLSKSVTATLPAALLLLAWWRHGSLTRANAALLAPFFAAGAASGILTAWLEKHHVGALGTGWSFSMVERLVIAGKNFWFYVAKTCWPHPLSFVYPRWQPHDYPWWHAGAPLAAIAVVLLLWRCRARLGRGPLAVALLFLVTLAPALGFFDFYPMRYSFVADHFAYLAIIAPVLGLLGGAAIGARRLFGFGSPHPAGTRAFAAGAALGALVLLLAALSWRRSAVFRDAETLWLDTLARNPAATIARVNLGSILAKRDDYGEALELFQAALAAEPRSPEILTNLGNVHDSLRHRDRAEEFYRAALRIDPAFTAARTGLGFLLQARGMLLAGQGSFEQAAEQFRRSLEIDPANAAARYNFGKLLDARGDLAQAAELYRSALRIDPGFPEAHNNLGVDLALLGRREEATSHLREALRLRPGYREAAVNLEVLSSTGARHGAPLRTEGEARP